MDMDKPEPPYGRRRMPDSRYREEYVPPETSYAPSSGTISTVTSRVFEAYKINPVMIAMILLLITILGALGWYMMRNDDRIYAYIAARDQQQADLWDRLVKMAKDCKDSGLNREDYPSLDFPKLTTPPQQTPNKRDGK